MPASRQRVLDAISHKNPDRVPLDFGSSPITGMHCSIVEALREHYGLEKRPVKVHEPYQMLGYVDEDLKEVIGVDVVGVLPLSTIFGYPIEGWKPWRTPWGQEVLVPGRFVTTTCENGDVYTYPCGDLNAPASGHMPQSGYFFDTIIRQDPIDEEHLNVEDNLEEFEHLSTKHLNRLAEGVRDAAKTNRAILVCLPGTALGDIALVPAPFLRHPKGIRDISEWYMSLAMRKDYIHQIFKRQVEIAINNLARINELVGNLIDIVVLCGTDFGTQQSTFCSEQCFRDLWLPYYKMMNDWIHAHTHWAVFKHSCGSVVSLLDAFIDSGFDIINPVQCSAAGMDPSELKLRFGNKLTFWGGGVDTQQTLPFGTPELVRTQVLKRCEIFSQEGGFVFNAIHNVQAQTPIENVVAMIEAVHDFNGTML